MSEGTRYGFESSAKKFLSPGGLTGPASDAGASVATGMSRNARRTVTPTSIARCCTAWHGARDNHRPGREGRKGRERQRERESSCRTAVNERFRAETRPSPPSPPPPCVHPFSATLQGSSRIRSLENLPLLFFKKRNITRGGWLSPLVAPRIKQRHPTERGKKRKKERKQERKRRRRERRRNKKKRGKRKKQRKVPSCSRPISTMDQRWRTVG